ncbi:MAG: hypothetical protein K6G07_04895 [Lachnospiraceae bacterium]|nr:hypothetical protein [Lachnospiraceae bacterium]
MKIKSLFNKLKITATILGVAATLLSPASVQAGLIGHSAIEDTVTVVSDGGANVETTSDTVTGTSTGSDTTTGTTGSDTTTGTTTGSTTGSDTTTGTTTGSDTTTGTDTGSSSDTSSSDSSSEPTPISTSDFIMVGGDWVTPVASYGSVINVVLPVVNMSTTPLKDVIVTPAIASNTNDWPFEITTSGYTQTIPDLPGKGNGQDDMLRRRELTWTFQVRKDVLNGYYKVPFNVIYYVNGGYETRQLTTYVRAIGAPGSGDLEDGGTNTSTPRMIVTGFDTNPTEVYAGDTFTLTLHLKNTSGRTPINNLQIDLSTPSTGKDTESTYEAFLPTSGSNTLYVNQIGAGGVTDVSIEMTAKSDLANKPYAIAVNMAYEDKDYKAYTASTNVSIPINQDAKFELSSMEILPADITVGGQSNVMFSIFNTGKITLYNVQVKFEGDSITGGDTFIGKLESGATGTVDAMVTGAAPTMDEGIVKAIVYYEDDAGNVNSKEQEFTLFVSEDYGEEEYTDDMYYEEEEGGGHAWVIFLIVGLLVIAAVVATVIIIKKKKKQIEHRNLLEELEEDADDDLFSDIALEEEPEAKPKKKIRKKSAGEDAAEEMPVDAAEETPADAAEEMPVDPIDTDTEDDGNV